MSNIARAFDHGKAFIPFVTCGDPSLETTEAVVRAMARAGADLIELGIPFSDPVAEGPVIQAASHRALTAGTTPDRVLEMVRRLRRTETVPMVLMTYANVVFSRGVDAFVQAAAEAGVDGLILPDVPYEEKAEFESVCRRYGLDFIAMVAPTSGDRIDRIVRDATGFVYCVSSLGVTGVREQIGGEVRSMIERVKAVKDIPCAVGFGIAAPEQAAALAEDADGIIVGSAIVQLCAEQGADAAPVVEDYVRRMKAAITQGKENS